MATTLSSTFGYTNTTASTKKTITPTVMSLVTNYAKREELSTKCVLDNTTCPLDQPEYVTFTCSRIKKVDSPIPNHYPPKVSDGVAAKIQLAELLKTTVNEDPTFRVDSPIVAELRISTTTGGYVTVDHVQAIVDRLVSALYKDDGTSRLSELLRSALEPTSN